MSKRREERHEDIGWPTPEEEAAMDRAWDALAGEESAPSEEPTAEERAAEERRRAAAIAHHERWRRAHPEFSKG